MIAAIVAAVVLVFVAAFVIVVVAAFNLVVVFVTVPIVVVMPALLLLLRTHKTNILIPIELLRWSNSLKRRRNL